MKNLIAQVCIPSQKVYEIGKGSMFAYIPELYQQCSNDAKEYANNIGADYKLITTHEYDPNLPAWYQRYALFGEAYDYYDNILQVDGDYAPVPTSPNVFDLIHNKEEIWFAVPDNKFDKYGNMKPMRKKSFDRYNLPEDFYYFNIGFYVMKKEARILMRENMGKYWKTEEAGKQFHDQDLLNKMVCELMSDKYQAMNKNWNGVFSVKSADYATHYAGMAKQNFSIEKHKKLKEDKMKREGGPIWHVPQWSTDIMKGAELDEFFG